MELLFPITSSSSRMSSGASFFNTRFTIPNSNLKNQFRNQISISSIRSYSLSSRSIIFPRGRRNFLIFANFSRPARRSNSLRKKLIHEQQVNQNPIPESSNSDFHFPERVLNDGESSNHVGVDVIGSTTAEQKSKRLGESVLWNRLDGWVDQYKKDIEFWGIGSGPIFTIFQDSNGSVKWISINEDEILKRNPFETGDSKLNDKISAAKFIAKEMESGRNVIPRNSSIAKFVIQGDESGVLKAAQGLSFKPEVFKKFAGVGGLILCSSFVFFSFKRLFSFKNGAEYTQLEKEMMRRKIKSRKEKEAEVLENGRVEILQVLPDPPKLSFEKPKLDKQELMRIIAQEKSKAPSSEPTLEVTDLSNKIQEIRDMASDVRNNIKGREDSLSHSKGNTLLLVNEKLCNEEAGVEHLEDGPYFSPHASKDDLTQDKHVIEKVENGLLPKVASVEKRDFQIFSNSSAKLQNNGNGSTLDVEDRKTALHIMDAMPSDTNCDIPELKNDLGRKKLKVIRTVKEAREYLSGKRGKKKSGKKIQGRTAHGFAAVPSLASKTGYKSESCKEADLENKLSKASLLIQASDSNNNVDSTLQDKISISVKDDHSKICVKEHTVDGSQKLHISSNHECDDSHTETTPCEETKNWIEDNFNEVEPVIKKIGVGFRDNYMVAREKDGGKFDANSTLAQLQCNNNNDEDLGWMEDDNLREIVFKVRENELENRDPFYLMDAEDKITFFKGLEKKVERENEKLSNLHEWLHSNIENLDYGADGISLYDPPEKFIPRWKGPLFEKSPEFFDHFLEQRKTIFSAKASMPLSLNRNEDNCSLKSTESNPNDKRSALDINDPKMAMKNQEKKDSKTIIEGSDGSIRIGKKTGKEFWQHTKKWSREFLESYNAETDPEVKSIMKDIGKDLDRWISEKEIGEAADLMDKMPERNKKFMEEKLNKLKREMEMFGPQAVVSKYREYAEENEEDYLWWLDLRHVLCIEMYTVHNGEERIGFYSLEMAADLELEPKPSHVIAFEDAGDCKNFCYIIQSHMEMLGTGSAFIVARPPKDAFREAKENGFGVTVIRKGELQLNVDQTLEEVEEQITEIGSKIYHDMIMKERSVDISSLMKGVFGLSNKATRRGRSRRRLKQLRKK